MAKSRRRKKNPIVRYFTPFGLRQICDITMLLGFIMLIVGMCVYKCTDAVMLVGLCLFIAGSLLAIYRSVRVMTSGINRRSPEFKSSIINIVIMSVILILAVVGLALLITQG